MILFFGLPNLSLFTFWKRLSNRKKDHRGALLQKRSYIDYSPLLMRSTFWFSVDSTLYLGHRSTQTIDWSLKEKKHMLLMHFNPSLRLLLPSAVVAPSSSDLLAEPSISPARNLLTDLWWNIINDSSSRMRRSQADSSLLKPLLPSNTLFENHLKCLIWIFGIFHQFLSF